MVDVIRIPSSFKANTASYCKANDLTTAQLAVMVLGQYEVPTVVVLFAEEFKVKHNLTDADYGVLVRSGKLGKYVYVGEEKYQYVKTVWHLCP
jgi:hypothetical protein